MESFWWLKSCHVQCISTGSPTPTLWHLVTMATACNSQASLCKRPPGARTFEANKFDNAKQNIAKYSSIASIAWNVVKYSETLVHHGPSANRQCWVHCRSSGNCFGSVPTLHWSTWSSQARNLLQCWLCFCAYAWKFQQITAIQYPLSQHSSFQSRRMPKDAEGGSQWIAKTCCLSQQKSSISYQSYLTPFGTLHIIADCFGSCFVFAHSNVEVCWSRRNPAVAGSGKWDLDHPPHYASNRLASGLSVPASVITNESRKSQTLQGHKLQHHYTKEQLGTVWLCGDSHP